MLAYGSGSQDATSSPCTEIAARAEREILMTHVTLTCKVSSILRKSHIPGNFNLYHSNMAVCVIHQSVGSITACSWKHIKCRLALMFVGTSVLMPTALTPGRAWMSFQ